jgi:hypothetical protein
MKVLFFLIIALICGTVHGQSLLDGKTYSIKLKVSGKKRPGREWNKDELSFSDGSFTSKEMGEGEKFPPFQYTLLPDSLSNDGIRFIAGGKNPGGSTIAWEGKVKGSKIEGVATWTNRNGPQKELFKGKEK